MSKLIRGCFALAMILMFSTPADCRELTTYLSCSGGVTMLEDSDLSDSQFPGATANLEYEPGYFIGVALGNQVDKIRFEAEIGYQKNKLDSVKVSGVSLTSSEDYEIRLTTLLFNLYYDFIKGSRFTPYLTAGLGLGNMKVDGLTDSDSVAEYQFGAGVAFRINEKIALDLKGRYLGTTDADFGTSSLDFTTINAIFDVRIYF